MEETEVFALSFTVFFLTIGCVTFVMRFFKHRETMAMIRHGMLPGEQRGPVAKSQNGRGLLAWGIGIAAVGMAMLCAVFPFFWTDREWFSMGPIHLPGLLVLFIGVALIIIFFANRELSRRDSQAQERPEAALPPAEFEDIAEPTAQFQTKRPSDR